MGRDFGMTSEPTKAIKAVAVGRRYHISYGGLQDLQYVGDVAATFVRALEHSFQGADAFNLRGAVKPIETFVAALGDVVPTSTALVTHGDRQLSIRESPENSLGMIGVFCSTPLRCGFGFESWSRGGDDESSHGRGDCVVQGCRPEVDRTQAQGVPGPGDLGLSR